jgi:hypothetical protein
MHAWPYGVRHGHACCDAMHAAVCGSAGIVRGNRALLTRSVRGRSARALGPRRASRWSACWTTWSRSTSP